MWVSLPDAAVGLESALIFEGFWKLLSQSREYSLHNLWIVLVKEVVAIIEPHFVVILLNDELLTFFVDEWPPRGNDRASIA